MTEERHRLDGDEATSPHDDPIAFDRLRTRATALRREGLDPWHIRVVLGVDDDDYLERLLAPEPPPDWAKRPKANDTVRLEARRLRRQGLTYEEIRAELDVSKSSLSDWLRDLPRPAPRWNPALARKGHVAQMRRMAEARASLHVRLSDERHQLTREAKGQITTVSDAELFFIGVALYWAEGQKDKEYARRECISFVNSDPQMIRVFLRWLDLLGVSADRLRCSVHIQAQADVEEATRFWSELTGVPRHRFWKPGLSKAPVGSPRLLRAVPYAGCLRIYVTNSARLYRQVEGWWRGIGAWAEAPGSEAAPVGSDSQ